MYHKCHLMILFSDKITLMSYDFEYIEKTCVHLQAEML